MEDEIKVTIYRTPGAGFRYKAEAKTWPYVTGYGNTKWGAVRNWRQEVRKKAKRGEPYAVETREVVL
jgi:hypothetical protein